MARSATLHWTTTENGQLTKSGRPIRLLVDDPEEQKWILHMAGLRQRGLSYHEIARDLIAQGVPTKKGGEWKDRGVAKILGSKTVQHWLQAQFQQLHPA